MACSERSITIILAHVCVRGFIPRYEFRLSGNHERHTNDFIAMVMMPMTTLALNQLPNELIPHGTAMNNTFRQMAGSIGTAVLVTIMATSAIPNESVSGLIHGVNVSFIVAGITAVVGFI